MLQASIFSKYILYSTDIVWGFHDPHYITHIHYIKYKFQEPFRVKETIFLSFFCPFN